MNKNLIPALLSLTSLFAIPARAELTPDFLKNYHWGDYSFDGSRVANAKKGEVGSFDNNKKTFDSAGATGSYHMTWGTEDIDNSQVLTVTESRVAPVSKDVSRVYARSSTFSGDKLRSSTYCFGTSVKDGNTKNELKCATATKLGCQRLLAAYAQEAKKSGTTVASLKDAAVATQYCAATLESYKTMAKALTSGAQSSSMTKNRDDVGKSDASRVKSLLDKTVNSGLWNTNNVSAVSNSQEAEKMVTDFAASLDGMQVLSAALQVCENAKGDFPADGGSNGASAASINKGAK